MIIIHASAKLNLCLDIVKKAPNGYHEIQTVFQELPHLQNRIKIKASKKDQNTSTPNDLANQAIQLLRKTYKLEQPQYQNIEIDIERHILPGSGLGGESSNAAAVLKVLNEIWNLNLSQEDLLELAKKLGMDVPFFIFGGTALGTNFGEKITPLPPILGLQIEVKQQSTALLNKTQEAYASLDLSKCNKHTAKTARLVALIKEKDSSALAKELPSLIHNDFETLSVYQGLPRGAHLCGSGPSTFKL